MGEKIEFALESLSLHWSLYKGDTKPCELRGTLWENGSDEF